MAIENNGDDHDTASGCRITADGMGELGNHLTVLRGYIQLMQRRIRRGQAVDEVELIRVLDIMEDASHRVSVTLAALAKPRIQD